MAEILSPDQWSCPMPVRPGERVVLGHGGGGVLSAERIEQVIVPAFGGKPAGGMRDSAVFCVPDAAPAVHSAAPPAATGTPRRAVPHSAGRPGNANGDQRRIAQAASSGARLAF